MFHGDNLNYMVDRIYYLKSLFGEDEEQFFKTCAGSIVDDRITYKIIINR